MNNKESGMLFMANVNARDKDDWTPLHYGAFNGDTNIVEILILAGATVDAEDIIKRTPLHYCAFNGHKTVVEVLVIARANINAEDKKKWTPLHCCALRGHAEVIKIIIRAGSKINAENSNKETPLHYSAFNGHYESVGVLISSGADINAKDRNQQTPLHYSVKRRHAEVVKILIGSCVNLENKNSEGPLHNDDLNCRKEREALPVSAGVYFSIERIVKSFMSLIINPLRSLMTSTDLSRFLPDSRAWRSLEDMSPDQLDLVDNIKNMDMANVSNAIVGLTEPSELTVSSIKNFEFPHMKVNRLKNLNINVYINNENPPDFIPATIKIDNANLVASQSTVNIHGFSSASDES